MPGKRLFKKKLTVTKPVGNPASGSVIAVETVIALQNKTCSDGVGINHILWVNPTLLALLTTNNILDLSRRAAAAELADARNDRRRLIQNGDSVDNIQIQIHVVPPVPSRPPTIMVASAPN